MKTKQIIAIGIWMFSAVLVAAGLEGVLTPNYPYLDGARTNLFINAPLSAVIGFLVWHFPD